MVRIILTIVAILTLSGMAYGLARFDFGLFLIVGWIAVPTIVTIALARLLKIKNPIMALTLYSFVFLGLFFAIFFMLSQGPLAGFFAITIHKLFCI